MDAIELLDDMERFETESTLAEMADGIMRSYGSIPSDPRTSESIVVRAGGIEFIIGGDIVKRDEFWTEA